MWSIKDARSRLETMLGASSGGWVQLDLFLEQYLPAQEAGLDMAKTTLAASFGATLEMARDGLVELQQAQAFAPLYLRRRTAKPNDSTGDAN